MTGSILMWPKSTRLARTLLASSASFLLCSVLAAGQAAGTTSTAAKVVPVASRLTQPIDDKQLVALKGTVHALANARNDRGAAPDGMALSRIHLAMKRSAAQEADLQQLIRDIHTPGSASYHKWLTPDQFGQRFGPSDADVATLTAWLGQHGFSVSKVLPGKQVMEISGSVGQFREAFHTQIHKYQVNGQTRYANASEPQIPAALAPVLGGFSSLNDFPYKSDMKLKGTAMYDPATHKAVPNWNYPVSSTGVDFPLAPGDFAVQYDLNPLYAAGTNGTGQTIAIINESNINPTLVAEYRSLFGLPASPVNVIIDGSDPGIDGVNNPDGPNGAAGEAYLDVEIAGSVAPQATIDLVIGGDTALENGLNLAIEHAVFADVAPVLSLSFSGCEGAQGAAANAAISNLWEEAAAQGQTVLVSSGDAGSAGCDDDNTQQFAVKGQAVNGLASTPYNLAIGGTDFYYSSAVGAAGTSVTSTESAQIDKYWSSTPSITASNTPVTSLQSPVPEQPWNNSQYGINLFNDYALGYGTTIAGAGGGASNCATGVPATNEFVGGTCAGYAKPVWQAGAGVPADGVRDTPDLSLFAANGENLTYYPICASDGDCNTANDGSGPVQISGVGGTSTSTPAFAGIMALVNQKYGPQGQAGFVLYPLATQFPSSFHDVVNGTNAVPCAYSPTSPNCIAVTGAPTITDTTLNETAVEGEIGTGTTAEYNATTGYDLASGLGSVDANNLVTNWGNVSFTASAVTLAPSQTAFVHGTAITVSGTVTPGSAVGSVALKTTSTEPLQAAQGAQAELNGAKPVFTVSGGTYSGSVNYLPGGTYTIFGAYSGDGTNAASTSTHVPIFVTPEASSLLFQVLNSGGKAVTAGSLPYGTQLQLSGQPLPSSVYSTCAVASPPASCSTATYTEPTGTVTFSDNSATLNAAPVNAEGDAEYNGAFALGAHSVTASYSGDNSYNPTTASPVTFTIVQDKPDISLYPSASTSSTSISAPAGLATLTVDVSNSANDSFKLPTYVPVTAPTGTVTVTGLGSTALTFPALQPAFDSITGGNPGYAVAEGVTTLVIPSSIAAGTYSVTVAYSGDTNYAANTATGSVTVVAASSFGTATTITATPSATKTSVQAAVQLAVTVSAPTGQTAPTGTVAVIAPGDYEVGAGTLTAGSSNTSTVTLSLNSEGLIQGTNVLSVEYLGSKADAPSVTTVTIGDGVTPTPSVTLVAGPSITISTAGGTGTSTIAVTPQAGFTGAVTLSCAVTPSNETDPPTCSISSPPAITGNAAAMATLTVNTTAASASLTKPRFGWVPLGGGVAMATLLFFLVPVKRRRLGTLLGAVALMAFLGFAAGCGGGGGTAITTPPANGGTSTGAYTVTVTGTATGVTIAPVTVSVTVN
jgi:subtilase family serine protease